MRIGVLALQGAFIEHIQMLTSLGAECVEVRSIADLDGLDGLVLPGGESTAQGKLLRATGLWAPLREGILAGLPVFGTCAGLILLSATIANDERRHLATMDIETERNAYGRQLGSFFTYADFAGERIPMSFIRAPYIRRVGQGVEVLSVVDGRIVAARQCNMLVTAFHPEITDSTAVHRYFLDMVKANKA